MLDVFHGNRENLSHLLEDFLCSNSGVLQVAAAAVGQTDTTTGRNPPDGEIRTAEPAGVVVDPAAVQLQGHEQESCYSSGLVFDSETR